MQPWSAQARLLLPVYYRIAGSLSLQLLFVLPAFRNSSFSRLAGVTVLRHCATLSLSPVPTSLQAESPCECSLIRPEIWTWSVVHDRCCATSDSPFIFAPSRLESFSDAFLAKSTVSNTSHTRGGLLVLIQNVTGRMAALTAPLRSAGSQSKGGSLSLS